MTGPLDHIGRRPKRSPFGTDLHIYRAPRPARRLRAKLILAGFMAAATLATGLFIHVRLTQKPDSLVAIDAEAEPAAAAPASTGEAETATLMVPVQPTKVRTVSIPAAPPAAVAAPAEAVDPDALGHDDPRWGPAKLAAEAKAKAARVAVQTAKEPPLAFAEPEAGSPEPNDDGDQTAAIPPTVIVPKPLAGQDDADPEPSAVDTDTSARTVTIARAVNMRSSPRSGSKVIRVVPAGVNVGLYSCKGWCEITYQGSRGFIYKSFLQGGGTQAAKPRAPAPKAAEKKPNSVLRAVSQR